MALRRRMGGGTSTCAPVGHEALLAVVYFGAVLVLAAAWASLLFRHRTAASPVTSSQVL